MRHVITKSPTTSRKDSFRVPIGFSDRGLASTAYLCGAIGRMMGYLLLAAGIAVSAGGAVAADGRTFYVDFDGGNDTHPGDRPQRPFRHSPGDPAAEARAAAVALQPGDRVVFKGGVAYRGALDLTSAGAPERPIVFDGNTEGLFGEGRAILDGSVLVEEWTPVPDEAPERPLYRATAPPGISAMTANLHLDGQMMTLAQLPTPARPLSIDNHGQYLRVAGERITRNTLRDERLEAWGGPALAGAYVMVYVTNNDVLTRRITGYDPQTHTLTFEGLGRDPAISRAENEARYSIVNATTPAVLNGPGQYAVLEHRAQEDGRAPVWLWPPAGIDPNRSAVTVALRNRAFTLGPDAGHVTIQGFVIRYYRAAIWKERHRDLDRTTSHIVIRDNVITAIKAPSYSRAILLRGVDDALVEENHLHDNPKMRGVTIDAGRRPILRNNRFERMGRTPMTFFRTRDGVIAGNVLRDNTGTHSNGMSIYSDCRNTLVEGNHVLNSNVALTSNNSTGLVIRNNVFCGGGHSFPMAFWENVSGDVLVEHNTLIAAPRWRGAFHIGGSTDRDAHTFGDMRLTLRNNIMSGPIMLSYPDKRRHDPVWHEVDRRHNLYLSTPKGFEPRPDEWVAADPDTVFVDFENRDFRLRPGSQAIGAGLPNGPGHDLNGAPRPKGEAPDLGAYEFTPGIPIIRGWTVRKSGTEQDLTAIAHGGGVFAAVGNGGAIVTSRDGKDWQARESGTDVALHGIARNQAVFVAVGNKGTILTSQNGEAWIKRESGSGADIEGVAWGGGQFVAVGQNGTVLTSENGTQWTRRDSQTTESLSGITHGSNRFTAVGRNGVIITSADAIEWAVRDSGVTHHLRGIDHKANTFVAVGDRWAVLTSQDGVAWKRRVYGNDTLHGVANDGVTFFAVGRRGALLSSNDGVIWQMLSSQATADLSAITCGSGTAATVGAGGIVITTHDYRQDK